MNEYDELMSRYESLNADWMRRVTESKERLGDPLAIEFYTAGVLLRKNGTLQMVAHHPRTHAQLWELSMAPGDQQVRITFPDKTTYLV